MDGLGKIANLIRLADARGRFKMLAIDQRDSLRAALARSTGRDPAGIGYQDLATAKAVITEVLSPRSTATLVDPVYGLPAAVALVPGDTALLVACEETGYARPAGGRGRLGRLIEGWSPAKAKQVGANAVKLLVHYAPEAPAPVREHQQRLVRTVGEQCAQVDLPFLLELVAYPMDGRAADSPEFARTRAAAAVESAREFSHDAYRVDVLKLEFPGDLKYAREFCEGAFDARQRPALYAMDDLRSACRALDAAAGRPWVILSGGVGIEEFVVALELAAEAGASGFLCGRAIWQEALPLYPDLEAMRRWLGTDGVANMVRAAAAAERARPWFTHPSFQERWSQLRPDATHEGWHRHYPAAPEG